MSEEQKTNDSLNKDMVHWVIQALYAVILVCTGFIASTMQSQINKLEDKADAAPMVYVQKSEYDNDQDRIIEAIERLSTKLEDKLVHTQDKLELDYNRRLDKLEKTITTAIMNQGK